MSRQVRLYLCFVVLCVSVLGLPADNNVHPVDNNPWVKQGNYPTKGHDADKLDLTPTIPAVKVENKKNLPVNERFPHAVLFGGTCGGTIISPNWILTAAHCTLFTGGKYVLAGTNNSDDGSGTSVRVKKLVVHPRFSVGPYWLDAKRFGIQQVGARFDYLLAELEEPLPLNNRTMAAAKLPPSSHIVLPNTHVGYAGYGALHHGETMRTDMHGMELEVLSEDKCAALTEYDPEDMICARGYAPNFDSACNGDSGSGLVDNNGVLVGIASWVENDAIKCENGAKVYFSKVAKARKWISQVTNL